MGTVMDEWAATGGGTTAARTEAAAATTASVAAGSARHRPLRRAIVVTEGGEAAANDSQKPPARNRCAAQSPADWVASPVHGKEQRKETPEQGRDVPDDPQHQQPGSATKQHRPDGTDGQPHPVQEDTTAAEKTAGGGSPLSPAPPAPTGPAGTGDLIYPRAPPNLAPRRHCRGTRRALPPAVGQPPTPPSAPQRRGAGRVHQPQQRRRARLHSVRPRPARRSSRRCSTCAASRVHRAPSPPPAPSPCAPAARTTTATARHARAATKAQVAIHRQRRPTPVHPLE